MMACMSAQSIHEKVAFILEDMCRSRFLHELKWLNERGSTPREVVHTLAVIQSADHLRDLGSSRDFDVQGSCAPLSTDSSSGGQVEGKS